jgi:hypothetical protein
MTFAPNYIRGSIDILANLGADRAGTPAATALAGATLVTIGRADLALAWLVSPRRRAEHAYRRKLIAQPDWPETDIGLERADIAAMPIDDRLAAITGWTGEPLDAFGGTRDGYLFTPDRVVALCAALDAINEATLRAQLDFAALDEAFVPPDEWLHNGEAIFASQLLPALWTLQDFYLAAAEAGEAVLILYT